MKTRTNTSAVRNALSLVGAVVLLAGSAMAADPIVAPGVKTGVATAPQIVPEPYNADYNRSGNVDVQDIFDYLTGWFAGKADCDVNGNGVLEGLDVLEYINAWFAAPIAAGTGKKG